MHSEAAFQSVQNVTSLLFNKKANKEQLLSLSVDELETIGAEIPSFEVPAELLANGVNIIDLISEHSQILNSKGEARRAIKGNAISVNKEKISSHEATINHEALIHNRFMMIENGKKNKYLLEAK